MISRRDVLKVGALGAGVFAFGGANLPAGRLS